MCAYDGLKPKASTGCGHDICHPGGALDPASAALCTRVIGGNATAVAAARCNAYPGCETFASCPDYGPSKCSSAHRDGGAVHTDEGICFKYFKAGKAGFHPDGGWTLFTKG